jgi:hypothetical protein
MEVTYVKDKDTVTRCYHACEIFNGCKYYIYFDVDETFKSEKIWIYVSSGKKRKDFLIFGSKDSKSNGGIRALIWLKDAMLNFPGYFGNPLKKQQYLVIAWSDSRRRDIYQRLMNEGFVFAMESGSKVLIKKITDI